MTQEDEETKGHDKWKTFFESLFAVMHCWKANGGCASKDLYGFLNKSLFVRSCNLIHAPNCRQDQALPFVMILKHQLCVEIPFVTLSDLWKKSTRGWWTQSYSRRTQTSSSHIVILPTSQGWVRCESNISKYSHIYTFLQLLRFCLAVSYLNWICSQMNAEKTW